MTNPAALQPRPDSSGAYPRETVCTNPATGREIGRSPLDTVKDLRAKVERLRAAQPSWTATPLRERTAMIGRALERLFRDAGFPEPLPGQPRPRLSRAGEDRPAHVQALTGPPASLWWSCR